MVLNEIYSKIHEYKNDNLSVLLERINDIKILTLFQFIS